MSEIEQNTQEWRDARAGHVTASRIKDVMTKPRSGNAVSSVREAYMGQLIRERLTHRAKEEDRGSYFDIERGKRLESTARSAYDLARGVAVKTAGFVKHPTLPWAGCSPDGYVGTEGLAQFKCPRDHVQWNWIINGVVPAEHRDQMLFELACHPDRKWNDFVSYVEDVDELPHLQLFIVRLYPDPERIAIIEQAVAKFNAELEEKISKLPRQSGKTYIEEMLEKSVELVKS